MLGGLGDLIGKLTAGGAGPQVNSRVGPGANEPIQPGQLGSALGQNTLNEPSQRTGMSQNAEPARNRAASAGVCPFHPETKRVVQEKNGSIRISYARSCVLEHKVNIGEAHGPSRISGMVV